MACTPDRIAPTSGAALLDRHPERPVVVAHRGSSHFAPENTVPAYRRAAKQGSSAAEVDVQLTADGHVVCLHDDTLDRTTTGTGPLAQQDLALVRSLDAGSWKDPSFAGTRVPLLAEVLAETTPTGVLAIEIKAGEGIVDAIGPILAETGTQDRVVIFSFVPSMVERAAAGLPAVPRLYLSPASGQPPQHPDATIDQAVRIGARAIGFDQRFMRDEQVGLAHTAGLSVFVYTVNGGQRARQLTRLGVDGLISDRPAFIEGVLDDAL